MTIERNVPQVLAWVDKETHEFRDEAHARELRKHGLYAREYLCPQPFNALSHEAIADADAGEHIGATRIRAFSNGFDRFRHNGRVYWTASGLEDKTT